MADKNLENKMYKGTLWSLLDNFVRQAITFAIFIVLARILNPSIFGLITIALLIVQIFRNVTYDSIATAIIRKASPDELDYNTGFWFCVGLSVPAFLVLYFCSDFLENWINSPGLSEVLNGTSFIILTSGLTRMHEVWLSHKLDFKTLAIRSSLSTVLGGITGILLAIKGYGVTSIVMQQLVTAFSELLLLWFITPWRPKFQFSVTKLREIFSYGKHVALTGITNFANQNSDAFFVTYYLGAQATGIYSTGKRITNTLNTVISASLLRVSLPAFSKIQEDNELLKNTYLTTTALTAMVTAPIFTGLSILSKDITLIMLGPKWLESVPVMQIVTIIGFLTSIGYYNQNIMLVKNKPQWQTRLTFLYAFTNLCAFLIFTRYGIVYTAIAFSARALLLYPVSAGCALSLLNVRWKQYIFVLLPSIISSALMVIVIIGISILIPDMKSVFRLTILLISGAISYTVFIYFLMPSNYRETAMVKLRDKFSTK